MTHLNSTMYRQGELAESPDYRLSRCSNSPYRRKQIVLGAVSFPSRAWIYIPARLYILSDTAIFDHHASTSDKWSIRMLELISLESTFAYLNLCIWFTESAPRLEAIPCLTYSARDMTECLPPQVDGRYIQPHGRYLHR